MKVKNQALYNRVKEIINRKYPKHSAYRSGAYVKLYKKLGGTFEEDGSNDIDERPLKRWFEEDWEDVGSEEYPVYRPTKRISEETPLTMNEIDKKDLKEKIKLKQKIKGESNLPPFVAKGGAIDEKKRSLEIYTDILGHLKEHLKEANEGKEYLDPRDVKHSILLNKEIKRLKGGCESCDMSGGCESCMKGGCEICMKGGCKCMSGGCSSCATGGKTFSEELMKYSNPDVVIKKAKEIYGNDVKLLQSSKPEKKYMIYDPKKNKWVHFGQLYPPMEDFTKHQDLSRRDRYLKRATKIKGRWKSNPYSPNRLSISLLW
jgi:hypothetical protein